MRQQIISKITMISSLVISLFILGCNQGGMQTNPQTALRSNPASGNQPDQNQQNQDDQWNKIGDEISGNSEGNYEIPMIRVNSSKQSITLALPMPPAFASILENFNSQLYQGISFSSEITDSNSSLLVEVPIKYLIKGTSFSNFNTLPNGDTLPYMPAGELRGFALNLPQNAKYKITVYFATNAVAAFIEIPSNIPFSYGNIVTNKDKTRQIGYYKIIQKNGAYNGGVYVATRIPSNIARALNDLISF